MFVNAILAGSLALAAMTSTPITVGEAAPAQATMFTSAENTSGGEGGWVLTQAGIAADRECVIHLSLRPYRAIVVSDSDPLCEAEAVHSTGELGQADAAPAGYPIDDLAAMRPVEYYGGTPGGAKCSTDAACSAYTRDKGGEYGYGASPEKAIYWDGIPAT